MIFEIFVAFIAGILCSLIIKKMNKTFENGFIAGLAVSSILSVLTLNLVAYLYF